MLCFVLGAIALFLCLVFAPIIAFAVCFTVTIISTGDLTASFIAAGVGAVVGWIVTNCSKKALYKIKDQYEKDTRD